MRNDVFGSANEDRLRASDANDCRKSVLRYATIDKIFTHVVSVGLPSGDSTYIPLQQMRETGPPADLPASFQSIVSDGGQATAPEEISQA